MNQNNKDMTMNNKDKEQKGTYKAWTTKKEESITRYFKTDARSVKEFLGKIKKRGVVTVKKNLFENV